MEMGTVALRLHVLIRTKSWLFPVPSLHRLHLLVDLDGKLLARDHHPVLWLHPECFRPTPRRHVCSISSFYSVGIFAGRGCEVSKILFLFGIPQWDSHRVGLLGQKLPGGVSGALMLYILTCSHRHHGKSALQHLWVHSKNPWLVLHPKWLSPSHIFCFAGSLAEMPVRSHQRTQQPWPEKLRHE